MRKAVSVIVRGRVQGVGFRPYVYQLSKQLGLSGTVQNNMDGVHIVWEGENAAIEKAIAHLSTEKPRLARIDYVSSKFVAVNQRTGFRIIESDRDGKSALVIPVDAAVCDDCLDEMRDPHNPRYRYPFINCTQCGPRYTIIEGLPYDRPFTSMKQFQMCPRCRNEYTNPMNRRHHAQPIACASCGPELSLLSMNGQTTAKGEEALTLAVQALEAEKIVAVKGIGGYHLACDASNLQSVERLRARKQRPSKSLAIMAPLEHVRRIAVLSREEEALLTSPAAPIVLLNKSAAFSDYLPELIAPGMQTIGVMLPYSPLHHLLFDDGAYSYLVMTSANPSGLPMLYKDQQAVDYLSGIADFVLTHNREIVNPIDDSVVRVSSHAPLFLRRARGYVPDPIQSLENVDGIVALGGQLKNTFSLGRNHQIFVGPHLGNLSDVRSLDHYEKTLSHLSKWMGVTFQTIALDAHPLYSYREITGKWPLPMVQVQHHHAHMVSCMAENGLSEPCLGIILDGTGYGTDGAIWGFEVLYGNAGQCRRLGHLRYTPLPGGDRAVREPWRNAAAMLVALLGDSGEKLAEQLFPEKREALPIIFRMAEKQINSPLAGTCGRLFDAISAILGLCRVSTYDGEAAVRLSEAMDPYGKPVVAYPYEIRKKEKLEEADFSVMLKNIAEDRLSGLPSELLIRRFHETLVSALARMADLAAAQYPKSKRRIILSGGSMNNPYLSSRLYDRLVDHGFTVYTHHLLPSGDGGLSLGQINIAAQWIKPGAGVLHNGCASFEK